MKNRLLNISIIILAVLVIYQSGQLWFSNISSYDSFNIYSIASFIGGTQNQILGQESNNIPFTTPYRIGISKMDTYNAKYGNLEEAEENKLLNQILNDNLGNLGEGTTLTNEELFSKEGIFYEYSFIMPVDIFLEDKNSRTSRLSTNIEEFNTIALVDFGENKEDFLLAFSDTSNNTDENIVGYKINADSEVIETLLSLCKIKEIEVGNKISQVNYVSCYAENTAFFKSNVWLPTWGEGTFSYRPISQKNPYGGSSGPLLSSVESQVRMFFDNPDIIYKSMPNDIFTYSDEYTVVRYYDNHILEYNNYLVDYKATSKGLLSDYDIAMNFIKQDTNIINDYFLSDYKVDGNKTHFYYNYTINNMEMALSNLIRMSDNGVNNFIEITIENGRVVNYKKYVYQFSVENQVLISRAINTYETFINNIAQSVNEDEFLIDNLKLAYVAEVDLEDYMGLSWVMEIDNQILIDRQQYVVN